ncbi:hypothetical protein BASA81_004865 [Batrachochytrium salamandrivorans]|nr:hypothetical protein BASA81_004865 [Batrachochytrium salamandrivorans]
MSEHTEENAKPNKVSQAASPVKRSFQTAITTSSLSSASSAASSPTSSPSPALEEDGTSNKTACNEEEEENEEEEQEDGEESEEMQDLRNKFRDTLRLVRTYKEEQEQLRATLEEQKRFSALMLKTHSKEIALKDTEIAEWKKRLAQVKEESDRFRVESQKEKAKLEATHRAEEERLKAELRTSNTATNKSGASSKSFSMKSFSTMFQSGKSQKMQQKMHADADVAERDQARMVTGLKADLDRTKTALKRLQVQAEEYSDCSAQSAMEIKRLNEHCELLETKLREGKVKFKKMQVAVQNNKQALSDMTLKAGWVAEQLQQTNEDLQYERSKHIKQSRLHQVKQGEELQRVKQELAELKKTRAAAVTTAPIVVGADNAKSKKAIAVAAIATDPVEEIVLLGTETIAELVALKAKQREQRDVKTDQVLQKNKDKAKKDKANQVAGEGDVIGQMMQRVRGCGADSDEDEDDGDQEWF